MVDATGEMILFGGETSYFRGANIPGKPRKQIMNFIGRPHIHATMANNRENGFQAFRLTPSVAISASSP